MLRLVNLLIVVSLVLAGCGDGDLVSGLSGDQTAEAVKLVDEANRTDLRAIKRLYKKNERIVQDIAIAMKDDDVIKVRQLAKQASSAINEGLDHGEKAIRKIQQARELEINPNFKKYLQLKEDSLRKLVEAFELRQELAQALSKDFVITDKDKILLLKAEMMKREQEFHKIIKEGQDLSSEANQLAKDLAIEDSEM